ncbi:MAG: thrombospondin type 3 repeat-containing protein, partial [Ilumatobacteraceae bacterium]
MGPKIVKAGGSFLNLSMRLVNEMDTVGTIGLVVGVVVYAGCFIFGWVDGGVGFASPEFNAMLVDLVANLVYLVLDFLLAATGLGILIMAAVAGVDALLTVICDVGGVEELETEVTGGCFTFSGLFTGLVTMALYSYDVMVDIDSDDGTDDFIQPGSPEISLTEPELGYVASNSIDLSLPVTANLRHKAPANTNWLIAPYLWFYSEENLRTSAVQTSVTSPGQETLSAERSTMSETWAAPTVWREFDSKDLYATSATTTSTVSIDFESAGVNRELPVNFNLAYAVPAAECWGIPSFLPPLTVPICYVRTFDGASSSAFDPVYYDVLPDTLDEFAALSPRSGGGYGLAWDESFAARRDADGDGLVASWAGGLDPDDTDWDTDDDGLSDAYELEQQQLGNAVSPRLWDTDNDGLTDAQELRLGTDPAVKDTDNDGLDDDEEVRHLSYSSGSVWDGTWAGGWSLWVYDATVYPDGSIIPRNILQRVFVSSDPLSADSDGDGIWDAAERQLVQSGNPSMELDDRGYTYHPGIYNSPPLQISLTVDTDSGWVRPGQTVTVDMDALANVPLEPTALTLNIPESLGEPAAPTSLGFDPTTFPRGLGGNSQSASTRQEFTVSAAAPNGETVVDAQVIARLESAPAPANRFEMSVSQEAPIQTASSDVGVAVSTRTAASSGDYVLAIRENMGDAADTRLVQYPASMAVQLDQDREPVGSRRLDFAFLPSDAANVDVACDSAGYCMTVWEQYHNCSRLLIRSLTVVDQQEPGSSGIEPIIYLDRLDGEASETLWYAGWSGGLDMTDGQKRGPNAYDFPVVEDFCGDARITVGEVDGPESIEIFDSYSISADTRLSNRTVNFSNADLRSGDDCHSAFYPNTYCSRVDVEFEVVKRTGMTVSGVITGPDGRIVKSQFGVDPVAPIGWSVGW